MVDKWTNVGREAWPERAILRWAEGVSHADTAREVNVPEDAVERLRGKWLSSARRIEAAEEKVVDVLAKLISELSLILEAPISQSPTVPAARGPVADVMESTQHTEEELHPATRPLIEILHHMPSFYGINRSNWTLESLSQAVWKVHGQRISRTTISRVLKDAGYSWKKARRVLTSPDPEYRDKVELMLGVLHSLKTDEMFFFVDELGPLQVRKYGMSSYTPKGTPATYPQRQRSRGSITLCGALSATTNQMTWFYGGTKDTSLMIDMVEMLFNQHNDKSRLYITWDAASWHRSNELVTWVDAFNASSARAGDNPLIQLIPLPANAQFLNVIEAVFSGMKRAVIHGSDYRSEDEMKTAISLHFVDRNKFFERNPARAGKKIWEIDFFHDYENIRSGVYREW